MAYESFEIWFFYILGHQVLNLGECQLREKNGPHLKNQTFRLLPPLRKKAKQFNFRCFLNERQENCELHRSSVRQTLRLEQREMLISGE